ncbi:hypothetical protein [Rhizobium sp. S96]|uniref:hypothetical protein n=1 Tax=Rhizobium sp. S96 TaxID=3055140 RepID=UPI0025AAD9F7|nr:hypothetical protein [Rhizobium sp. S96]MDM9619072.1 hypothetical protein [Rhizobium sp. S96]
MTIAYTTGQIALTNGSAVITGIGTGWEVALIGGGFIAAQADGNMLPIESVDSDTQITAAIAWAGATGTYDYALVRDTAWLQQLNANSNTLARVVTELEAGTIYKYDASGDLAGRVNYDDRAKGYSYLVSVGVSEPALYVKASSTPGDWDGPFSYGTGPIGPKGDQGDPGPQGIPGAAGSVYIARGTYAAGTAYAKDDTVLYNGSTYIARVSTTGNAPPDLPTTSNTYWQLVAQKGTDGTGTGDVTGPSSSVAGRIAAFGGTTGKAIVDGGKLVSDLVTGPASVTDSYAALFDGTTGKLLKALSPASFRTWLQQTAASVSFDNSVANLAGSPATVQAAIEKLASGGGGKNDAILAIEIADLKGQRLGMVGGVADSFDDETGVNTGGSTNQSYDATNDWYRPTISTGTLIAAGTGTAIGDTTALGGLAAAFDGVTTQALANCARTVSNTATNGYVGKNYTGAAKAIQSATLIGSSDNGLDGTLSASTITLVLRGKNGSAPTSRTDGTSLGTASFSDAAGVSRTITSTDPMTAWDYVWFDASTTASSGIYVAEAQFFAPVYDNMTLVSTSYAAASVPSTGRIALQTVEVDAITINTDVSAEVSRDGGTTWTAITLSLSTNLGSAKVYEGSGSLGAQPSGTSMRWRIKTLNNKNVDISGVVLQWS